jgi:hypothetical protein
MPVRPILWFILVPTFFAACAGHTARPDAGTPTATPQAPPVTTAPPPTAPAPGDQQPQAPEPYQGYTAGDTLGIRHIGPWTHTGVAEPLRAIIRDPNAWAQFWSRLGLGDRPEVDFSKELLIAVASGQQRTGGFSITVDRVTNHEGELMVQVLETSPGPNCMTTSELTQPVDVVAIPRVEFQRSNFAERKTVSDCR